MSKHSATEITTALAVKLGTADIDRAHALGVADASGTAKSAEEVCDAVKARPMSPAQPNPDKYGPEQVIPRLDMSRSSENGVLSWTASSFDDLWMLPVRDDMPEETYGKRIHEAMKSGGAFYNQLDDIGKTLDDDGGFGLHPKRAFYRWFLIPFSMIPKSFLEKILEKAG